MTSGAEFDRLEGERAHHRGEREVRADRQVDAAGQDHQLLAHRDDGDDGGLRGDVGEVAGLQEVRAEAEGNAHTGSASWSPPTGRCRG